MKQQFFVGDVVKIVDMHEPVQGAVWTSTMDDCHGRTGTVVGIVDYTNGYIGYVVNVGFEHYNFATEWLKIVERAWQKNTGEQPVDGKIEVEIKLPSCATDKAPAYQYRWDFEDSSGDIVEWRIADSTSNVEQLEGIPPSHVALGEELAALDATSTDVSTEQDKKHSHYFKKCGYDYVDVYRILKMFDVTDPCISHACKKLLVSGGRGFKDIDHDIQDVIDTLVRWQEMREEDDDA